MTSRELTDEEINEMRLNRELECHCDKPIPQYLSLWDAYQCIRCWRKWYLR